MLIWIIIATSITASLAACVAFFLLQERIRVFRYARLRREAMARWSRLDLSGKVEALRRLRGAPLAPVASETELDGDFCALLAKVWRRMRQRGAYDLQWLAERLTAAGV